MRMANTHEFVRMNYKGLNISCQSRIGEKEMRISGYHIGLDLPSGTLNQLIPAQHLYVCNFFVSQLLNLSV